jgi:hypothetical protein
MVGTRGAGASAVIYSRIFLKPRNAHDQHPCSPSPALCGTGSALRYCPVGLRARTGRARLNLGLFGISWDTMGVNGKACQPTYFLWFSGPPEADHRPTDNVAIMFFFLLPASIIMLMVNHGLRLRAAVDKPVGSGEKNCQMACKPGSVPPRPKPGHGWPFLWDAGCPAPRATDPDGSPETGPVPSLFGLAPGGVYRAAPRCRSARCALTAPFHPYPRP